MSTTETHLLAAARSLPTELSADAVLGSIAALPYAAGKSIFTSSLHLNTVLGATLATATVASAVLMSDFSEPPAPESHEISLLAHPKPLVTDTDTLVLTEEEPVAPADLPKEEANAMVQTTDSVQKTSEAPSPSEETEPVAPVRPEAVASAGRSGSSRPAPVPPAPPLPPVPPVPPIEPFRFNFEMDLSWIEDMYEELGELDMPQGEQWREEYERQMEELNRAMMKLKMKAEVHDRIEEHMERSEEQVEREMERLERLMEIMESRLDSINESHGTWNNIHIDCECADECGGVPTGHLARYKRKLRNQLMRDGYRLEGDDLIEVGYYGQRLHINEALMDSDKDGIDEEAYRRILSHMEVFPNSNRKVVMGRRQIWSGCFTGEEFSGTGFGTLMSVEELIDHHLSLRELE